MIKVISNYCPVCKKDILTTSVAYCPGAYFEDGIYTHEYSHGLSMELYSFIDFRIENSKTGTYLMPTGSNKIQLKEYFIYSEENLEYIKGLMILL